MRKDIYTAAPPSSTPTQVFVELARLGLAAGDPACDMQAIADALLACVQRHCVAPLGALLLSGGVSTADTLRMVSLPGRPDSRFFALATCGIADPRILASKPAALEPHMDTATLVADDIWVTQPVPLASTNLGLSLDGPSPTTIAPITQALVLLGWPVTSMPSATLVEARETLHLLADSLGATLSHVLLRQQVRSGSAHHAQANGAHTLHATAHEVVLREVRRLNDELLGTISHELRSPLAAIRSYAAALLWHEERLSSAVRRQYLGAIEAASGRLSVNVERVLELYQLETGATTIGHDLVAITSLTREAVAAAEQQVAHLAPAHAFQLRSRLPAATSGPSDFFVRGDGRRLRMVLDQLLENAVKFSPHGGDIELDLQPGGAETGQNGSKGSKGRRSNGHSSVATRIEITVRDHGMGIPADHLSRIFDRFQRIESFPAGELDGLGIGLALCKRVTELHGGMLWAESEEGKGSRFHLILPIAR